MTIQGEKLIGFNEHLAHPHDMPSEDLDEVSAAFGVSPVSGFAIDSFMRGDVDDAHDANKLDEFMCQQHSR